VAVLVAVAGAAAGSVLGGPTGASVGWIVGSIVGNILFPPEGTSTLIEGPRLGDLTVTGSAYGAARAIGFGTIRQSGNIIWSAGIEEHRDVQTTRTGGKGGGGGSETTTVSYSYTCSFAVAFGRGPAADVLRIWADGKVIYDKRGTGLNTQARGLTFRFYPGDGDQLPDPIIQADREEERTPAFRGTCYIVFDRLPLGDFGNRIPVITAEIAYAVEPAALVLVSDLITEEEGGAFDSYQTNQFAVDWERGYGFLVSVDISSPLDGSGFRRINLETMVEDRQISYRNAINDAESGGIGTTVDFVAPDGALIHNLGGSNCRPIVRLDPNSLRETARFGVSSVASGFSPTAWEACMHFACISLYGAGGRVDYLLAGSIYNSFGILRLPTMSYVWDVDTAMGGPGSSFVRGVVGGRVADGTGDGYVLTGGPNAPSSENLKIWRVRVSASASFSPIGGENVTTGVEAEVLAELTPGDLVPGETTLRSVGYFLVYDQTDDTIMFHVQGHVNDTANRIVKFDPETRAVSWRSAGLSLGPIDGRLNASRVKDGTFGFVQSDKGFLVDTSTGLVLVEDLVFETGTTYGLGAYDSRTETFVGIADDGQGLARWFLRRAAGVSAVLADVVAGLCGRVGLTLDDLDVTDLLDRTVGGYVIGRQSTARAAIEPLARLFLFDGVETDHLLRFVQRGREPVLAIAQADMVLPEREGAFFEESRTQEVELPDQLTVVYMDRDNDYQQGAQTARRIALPIPAMRSRNHLSLSIAAAMWATFVKQQAEKALFSSWAERSTYSCRLPWGKVALDPGDVVTIALDSGASFRARVAQADVGEALGLEVSAVGEEPAQFTSTVTGDRGEGLPQREIRSTVAVRTLVLDSPLLRDADEPAGRATVPTYFFMGGYQAGQFRRGVLFKSADGVVYARVGESISEMNWGTAASALGDPPFGNPFATDEENELRVVMAVGGDALASVTQTEMLNGANAAALLKDDGGLEVIQFRDVLQNQDGSYTLRGLLRGRRGTETMARGHLIGETFLLLIAEDGGVFPLSLEEVGQSRLLKGVGAGQMIEDADPLVLASAGRALRPYATVQHSAEPDGDDVVLAWVRRTRVGGALQDYVGSVPLGEDAEEYELDILDGPGGSVVRTVTGLTEPTYTYTAAQQSADGFTPPVSQITILAYQISAQVGRGFAREVTLHVQ